jgi:hypothetical protein
MPNKWLAHVKKTMKNMKAKGTYEKGKGLKQVIMAAKKTWHKAKKGGAEGDGKDSGSGSGSGSDSDEDSQKSGETTAEPLATAKPPATVLGGRRNRKTRRRRHSRRR